MELLRKLNQTLITTKQITPESPVVEDAAGGAVGGGDIAAAPMPLHKAMIRRQQLKGKKVKNIFREDNAMRISSHVVSKINESIVAIDNAIKQPSHKISEAFELIKQQTKALSTLLKQHNLLEDENQSFDPTEVFAKLKSLEAKEKVDKNNTVIFGMEDDDGNLVRVTVRQDQANDFEKALEAILASGTEDAPDEIPEVAEILFKLKDRFDIVDVTWPEVQEDEEEDQQLPPGQQGEEGTEGGEEGGEPEEMVAPQPDNSQEMEQASSLLTQVIDMMKADADARKADAQAKIADARARETEAAVRQAEAKVKHEEEILDMESEVKAQKEQEKEAKRLAQLAKWKHDMDKEASGEDMYRPAPTAKVDVDVEEEERSSHRMSPADIAEILLKRVKS